MTPDEQGRYDFELWCQYTRQGLNAYQVGDLVGVENYSLGPADSRTYSVLTLTQVFPSHFANQGRDAFPGHMFQSMRAIKDEFERQLDRPLYPTTTIRSLAVSTGWQFSFDPRQRELPSLDEERNLPMTGAEVRPLSMAMVDRIINRGLEAQPLSPFSHNRFPEINVKLDVPALLTTHFGIFGFTNAGKSNLVSSMVSSWTAGPVADRANFVIVDPNDEYLGLMMDRFTQAPEDVLYIHVGVDSLPGPAIPFIGDGAAEAPEGVLGIMHAQMKLPVALRGRAISEYLRRSLTSTLRRTRIAVPAENVSRRIQLEINNQTPEQAGPPVRHALRQISEAWTNAVGAEPISAQAFERAINALDPAVRNQLTQALNPSQHATADGVIDRTIEVLRQEAERLRDIPDRALVHLQDLVNQLNDPTRRLLVIVTARRDSELKEFVVSMGNWLYEARRRQGIIDPTTVFLFDEADLFVPLDTPDESTARSKEFCITLARRGRKFHLGIGIATQKATYLDTEVMGNLHTYFVSKLPRHSDRERVAEAFGIGEEQLAPTFTFRPGNWLIISHDATALKGVPIPVTAVDANARILRAVGERGGA